MLNRTRPRICYGIFHLFFFEDLWKRCCMEHCGNRISASKLHSGGKGFGVCYYSTALAILRQKIRWAHARGLRNLNHKRPQWRMHTFRQLGFESRKIQIRSCTIVKSIAIFIIVKEWTIAWKNIIWIFWACLQHNMDPRRGCFNITYPWFNGSPEMVKTFYKIT